MGPPIPKTLDGIYLDYTKRREGLLLALLDDSEDFFQACDPAKENLCLYGCPDGTWAVDLPADEVPPELPEPVLGINFARDGMERKDWLALCAVHSDAWLMAVLFFFAARFDDSGRAELFSLVNQHPTVYEVVTGRASRTKVNKRKVPVYGKAAAAAAQAAAAQAGGGPGIGAGRVAQRPRLDGEGDVGPGAAQGYGIAQGYGAAQGYGVAQGAGYEGPGAGPYGAPGADDASRRAPAATEPLPTGRKLTYQDVGPSLVGRQAELFWPDDGKWYLVEVTAVDVPSNKLKVTYATGEDEVADIDELVESGHMSLLAG